MDLPAEVPGPSMGLWLCVQQAHEHFRTELLARSAQSTEREQSEQTKAYLSFLSGSMQAALPMLLSAGFTTVTFALSTYGDSITTHTYHCAQCQGEVSMTDVVKRTAESDLQYYLLSQHTRHNPLCKFFEQLKRESVLPELFFPDTRQRSSERKVQAALRDCMNRRTKFVKSFQYAPEFTVMPPPGDPTVSVFNPWTNTEFDQVCWNSIVPSCTYVLA